MNVAIKVIKWIIGIGCVILCVISFIGEFFPHMNGFTFIEATMPKGKSVFSSILPMVLICLPLINAILFLLALCIRWLSILAAIGSLIFGLFVEFPVSFMQMMNGLTKPWIGTTEYTIGTGYHMASFASNMLFFLSLLFIVLLLVDFLKSQKNEARGTVLWFDK